MRSRHILSAATALTLGLALILTSAPASATSEKPAPTMLQALQRDLNLTAEQAETRLLNEKRLGKVEGKIRNTLGDRFAGSWLSGDAATLTVAVTDAAAASDVTASGAKAQVVTRTLADLDAVKARLDAVAAPATVPGYYVDVRANAVVVLARDQAAADAFVASAGVDAGAVRVEASQEQPQPYYDLRGGEAYYINNSGRCSIGFSITRGSTNGFVTAGHCGTAGASTQGFNRVAQGTFQGSSFPGNDYAWVAVNANWTPRPVVIGSGGSTVNVAGSSAQVVGGSICRSGSTTGWRCGVVQQLNATVTYPQGTVTGLTRTNACAEPGDSGGSWISGDQAQGVTSGGSGNCTTGGTTYFQPVNEILSTYGLTLVTQGGGGGGTTCSGYANTYTGSLTSGANVYLPNNSYYQSTVSGTHRACLDGPNGTDFDLYLQRWNGSAWANVASGTSSGPDETVTYNGTAGYYRLRVHAYSGSGAYSVGSTRP
ncbi:serine protease [Acrocarpospora phusangensis]|uniref:Serine protease n=1 Tax=Acrocarpospora phusangensis TaxID=1070424 RepID=A0A919Q9A1_9ACTN|nr:S1 family peptidase [Acrocarpospora phusangensis]GIH24383.1 serine protease [Acrocarpospora phusangensis]